MYTILDTKKIIKGSYADPKKEPGIFPIVNLPLDAEGDDMELNDFQWVAPTDRWLEWLKENPRDWQAESEDSRYEFDYILVESYSTEEDPYLFLFQPQNYDQPTSESYLQSFDEFAQIYEEESDSGSEELTGRAVKLAFALEKLNKEGKLKEELNPSELDKAKEYAIIFDPVDSANNEVIPSGRNAVRFKLLSQDKETISVGKIDYSLLTDEDLPDNMTAEEQGELMKGLLDVAGDVGKAGVWGLTTYGVATTVGGLASTYLGVKGIRRWMNRGTTTPPPGGTPPAGPGLGARIGTWLSGPRAWLSGTRAASGLRSLHVAAAGIPRLGSLFGGAASAAAGGSAAVGAGIAAGVLAIVSAAQQVYNWSSTNQAPTYSKLKSFAKDSFVPKNIPAGDLITVCWTADGGKGFWGNITNIFKDDTRTTMNLMKLANTDKKAVFLLLSVNSEQIQKEMSQYYAILFSFDLDSAFEHGYLDNDDLEFQIIRIKPLQDFSTPTSFVAYCEWSELESAFNSAPDSPFVVPADAPDSYVFNYQQGDQRANIQGSLLSAETIASQRSLFESDSADLSDVVFISNTSVLEGNKALGFNEFWRSNSISLFEEDKNSADESKKDSKSVQLGISKDSDYSQTEIIVYEVSSNEFANPNASGNPPEVNYFIVDKRSLSATDGQSVKVESSAGKRFQDAKYGLAIYKEETEDTKQKKGKGDEEDEESLAPIPPTDGKKDTGSLLTSPDDVSIKDRRRRTVIKDEPTNREEDVNIIDDILTNDDKKSLGIQDWKTLTKIVLVKDKEGYPEKVILKNQTQGRDRTRRIKRGESGFETAVKIADKVKSSIKYK